MREHGRAGDIRVRAICLPDARNGGKLNLAVVGANARGATEDSIAVGYLEPLDPRAGRFTHPILEAAGIAWISRSSGKTAMERLLAAIEAADPGSLRKSVRDELEQVR